jgi:uncharacterized protein DUF6057
MKAAPKSTKTTPAVAPAPQAGPQLKTGDLKPIKFAIESNQVVPALVFLSVYCLCLWKWVEVGLIYHGGGQAKDFPTFYWGWEFARDFRTHPGGLMEYCSAFLAQSLRFSGFGALVLTAHAALMLLAANGCLKAFGAQRLRLLGFIPPILLLALYAKYRLYFAPVLNFTITLVLSWLWLRWCAGRGWWRLVCLLVLAFLLYAAAPSGLVLLLFVAALFEFRAGTQGLKLLPVLGLCALAPWLAGASLFGFTPGEAYAKLLPLPWDSMIWSMRGTSIIALLYLVVPIICLGELLRQLVLRLRLRAQSPERASTMPDPPAPKSAPPSSKAREPRKKKTGSHSDEKPWLRRFCGWKWETACVVVATLGTVFGSLNRQVKAFVAVDYFAWRGQWPEVIVAAEDNPRNPFVACAVVQARYHTGQLTRELPWLATPSDLLLYNDKQQSHWFKSQLYFDLGYVNMALHHLTESVEFYGERPILLQRLAMVNLALGNLPTARIYLGTLARAPFQGRWARDYLARIEADPGLGGDEEIKRLRSLMVRKDYVLAFTAEEELQLLLGANRQNRMAFEYLMTYYLMTKNLTAFVKNIARVKDFPGLEVSALWDEALLLARQSGQSLDLPGHAFLPEAQARVDTLTQVVANHSADKELARRELEVNYAKTYSYYYYFHR